MQWYSQAVHFPVPGDSLLALSGPIRASCCCFSSVKSYAAQGNLPNRLLLKCRSHEDNAKAIPKVTKVKF